MVQSVNVGELLGFTPSLTTQIFEHLVLCQTKEAIGIQHTEGI